MQKKCVFFRDFSDQGAGVCVRYVCVNERAFVQTERELWELRELGNRAAWSADRREVEKTPGYLLLHCKQIPRYYGKVRTMFFRKKIPASYHGILLVKDLKDVFLYGQVFH